MIKTDEFSSVFRLRPAKRTEHFVLYAKQSPLQRARLGIVVAKRFAPRAVTRNTIKRQARELFRASNLKPCDYIIRLSRPINSKKQPATAVSLKIELKQELLTLLSSHFCENT